MYIVIDDTKLSHALSLMHDEELAKAVKSVIVKSKVELKAFCEVVEEAMRGAGKR